MESIDALEESAVLEGYIARTSQAISSVNLPGLTRLLEEVQLLRREGRTLFVAGNGGSASTASHIALDWMMGTRLAPALRVISLAESSATVTATGNDFSFEDVFSRQLFSLGEKGDAILLISASGNSPNLLHAAEAAREMGIKVLSMTGFDGGALSRVSDLSIHVPTDGGDYGVAEDAHLAICHAIKESLISAAKRE